VFADEVLIGPLWAETSGTCPDCLDYWLMMNGVHAGAGKAGLPDAAAAEMIVDALDAVVGAGCGSTARSVRYATGALTLHHVVARRDCARCGLSSAPAIPLRAHCSRLTGIVTSMEMTEKPTAGAFRTTAVWTPPLPASRDARPLLLRQQAYGRGRTPDAAFRSCVGEALERYSLIYRGDEALVRRSYDAAAMLHPDEIQLFSDAQYARRGEWNASADELFWVPERFDPTIDADWMAAFPLSHGGEPLFVPAACCLMWYQFRPGEPEFARADTIGCAAGPSVEAAIAGALLEWVERDALAIWWDNRLRRPGVLLESFDYPELLAVADGLATIGRTLTLLDCTTDLGIPAYVAVAARTDGSEPLIGAAADLDARTAAYRAASEAGQVWYEVQRSGRLSEPMRDWLLHETTERQPFLQPLHDVEAPALPAKTTSHDVWREIVGRLQPAGLDAWVVDHSRSDVALRVVRCIVPGLRHVWNRRAPGRLYDVPVAMGWLSSPTPEDQLNPTRCMI
jgi:ribosomal protein S12 methylthiotransferase accessory factor